MRMIRLKGFDFRVGSKAVMLNLSKFGRLILQIRTHYRMAQTGMVCSKYGFPEKPFEQIDNGVIAKTWTAIESEFYAWCRRQLMGIRVKQRHTAFDILRQ
jgi:hypothetical protein